MNLIVFYGQSHTPNLANVSTPKLLPDVERLPVKNCGSPQDLVGPVSRRYCGSILPRRP